MCLNTPYINTHKTVLNCNLFNCPRLQIVSLTLKKLFRFWNASTDLKEKTFWHETFGWWWWIVFLVWFTDERRLTPFPTGTIVTVLIMVNLWYANVCPEPEFKLSWIKLCSSDNHHSPVLEWTSVKKYCNLLWVASRFTASWTIQNSELS